MAPQALSEGAIVVPIAGHDVALDMRLADRLLGLLMEADDADAYFAVHDVYVAAGGISYGNGGFRLGDGRAA